MRAKIRAGIISVLCMSGYITSTLYIRRTTHRAGAMHNAGGELRRIPLPRTPVNKAKKKNRSPAFWRLRPRYRTPSLGGRLVALP